MFFRVFFGCCGEKWEGFVVVENLLGISQDPQETCFHFFVFCLNEVSWFYQSYIHMYMIIWMQNNDTSSDNDDNTDRIIAVVILRLIIMIIVNYNKHMNYIWYSMCLFVTWDVHADVSMCELDGCCVDLDDIPSSVLMTSLDISCRTKRGEDVRKALEEADKFN